LIVTAGPWFNQLNAELPIRLQILRKQQHWFQINRNDIKYQNGFPCFLVENDRGCFYGFPEIDTLGMKIAEHSGGQVVTRPDDVDRLLNQRDLERCEQFLRESFEFTRHRLVHFSACMYSMSTDGHFIIDHHPQYRQIVFAAGMSGHGYKFAPIIGERLVGMLENEPDPLFDFLQSGSRQLA
jgi:glycine/D-amino acid oxidase-like deaminating enzyme